MRGAPSLGAPRGSSSRGIHLAALHTKGILMKRRIALLAVAAAPTAIALIAAAFVSFASGSPSSPGPYGSTATASAPNSAAGAATGDTPYSRLVAPSSAARDARSTRSRRTGKTVAAPLMDSASAERQPMPAHPDRGSSRTGSSARPMARAYGRFSRRVALGRAGAPGAALPSSKKAPAKATKADARTRTGDPSLRENDD